MSNAFRNWITSPSELIADALDDGLCNREALRKALNLSDVEFEALLDGQLSLSANMAKALTVVLGGTSKFWLNVDARYQVGHPNRSGESVSAGKLAKSKPEEKSLTEDTSYQNGLPR